MGYDRISELPDSLLTQILSNLPTKDSVKTSLLSKRWEFLWLRVPALDLRVNDFPLDVFPSFIENFLEFNKKSRMQKLKIRYEEESPYSDQIPEWIGTAVDRGIQHLDVETDIMDACVSIDPIPQNIYKSNTLVSLYLVAVGIETPEFAVSLPCLKIMYLEELLYDYDDGPLMLENLISGCPVLEDLTLIRPLLFVDRDVLWFIRVRSQALKRFRCTFYNYPVDSKDFTVEIDAPRLEYMSLRDYLPDRIVVKNLSSLFMIDINPEFNDTYDESALELEDLRKRDIFLDFLNGISSVRHMIISQPTLEVLYRYSKLGKIPKFDNLYRLQARFSSSKFDRLSPSQAPFSSSMLQVLPVFLESFPNLRNLILEDVAASKDPEQTELTFVPQYLLSTLEYVEIHTLIKKEESWKKLVRYFLENSVVLKKLILHFRDSSIPNRNSDIFKELLTCTKRSSSCQIIIR